LNKVVAGNNGNYHSSQKTSQSQMRGWGMAFVADNFSMIALKAWEEILV
jgi:hypothetical protein